MKTLSAYYTACVFVLVNTAALGAQEKSSDQKGEWQTLYNFDTGSLAATGKVVGPNSVPQAGVPVQVQGPLGTTHVYTDAKGSWSLYKLPPGTYQAHALIGTTSETLPSVNFTIKAKGWFESVFGSNKPAVAAPEIKLDNSYRQ